MVAVSRFTPDLSYKAAGFSSKDYHYVKFSTAAFIVQVHSKRQYISSVYTCCYDGTVPISDVYPCILIFLIYFDFLRLYFQEMKKEKVQIKLKETHLLTDNRLKG